LYGGLPPDIFRRQTREVTQMSERPDADITATEGAGANTYTPPPDPPKTVSKPGTGSSGGGPDDDKEKHPKFTPSWSGSDLYPDGFEMTRQDDGRIWLHTPDGDHGVWDETTRGWVDGSGNPKPDGWSNGHAPTTQTYQTGPSQPARDRP
jgi:hypothetical protein